MGTELDPDPEYGIDCNAMRPGGGRFWPIGKTPKEIVASFSGMVRCDPPPSPLCSTPPYQLQFTMIQQPARPCEWVYDDGVWKVGYSPDLHVPPYTLLNLVRLPGWSWFRTLPATVAACKTSLTNQGACGLGLTCAHLGFGTVTWLDKVKDIINSMHFHPLAGSKYELFAVSDTEQVIRIANTEDHTHVKFLITTADFY